MNDEQLDKILKKALTPQRGIKEEEIVLKKRRKEEKMMRKKRMKMAGIAGTVAAALALACIVPQTSFAEQLKKMFQGYWGQRSELSDYVTRGVFSDQDEHMIFSVEEILSDEVVVSAVVRYEAKDETGEKWLATKGPAGSESYDENGNLFSENQLYLMWGKKNDYRTLTSNAQLIRGQSDKKVQYFVLDQTDGEWSSRLKKATLCYDLPTKAGKTTELDTSCNVPVYEYTLKAKDQEQISPKFYEPKRMRLTQLSVVIYGTTTGYFRKTQKETDYPFGVAEWGKDQESIGENLENTSLIYQDGTRNWDITESESFREINDANAAKKYADCNAVIQWGTFYNVTPYLGLQRANKITPENASKIVMRTKNREVTYELTREE